MLILNIEIKFILKVVKCNLLDVNELTKQFAGHDAILSSLGSPGLTCSRITFPLDSMKVIVSAMRSNKLKRLILVSSQYTKRNDKTFFVYISKFSTNLLTFHKS